MVYSALQGAISSRTANNQEWPWYVLFRPASMGLVQNDGNFYRSRGKSVRLVCLAQ